MNRQRKLCGPASPLVRAASCLCAAALLLALAAVFSACAGSGGPETGTASGGTPAGEPDTGAENVPPTELVIAGGDEEYTIIRIMDAPELIASAGVKLNRALRDKCDAWGSRISEDWYAGWNRGDLLENDSPEIVVGRCNRKESADISETLGEYDYSIEVRGRKLLIVGGSDLATYFAVGAFIEAVLSGDKTDRVTVPASFSLKGKVTGLPGEGQLRLVSWNLGGGVGDETVAVNLIETVMADLICIQEANAAVHSQVISKVIKASAGKLKYAMTYHAGTSTLIYTPIVYNSEKLTLVEAGSEMLDGRYPNTNSKCVAWAVFDDRYGNRYACLNFHGAVCLANYKGYENMTAAERNAQADTWRRDNARQLIDLKRRINEKYGSIPLSICGDCNFTKTSVPYSMLSEAGFYEAELTAKIIVKSGYKTYASYGTKPGTGNSIDHIFGIDGLVFDRYDVLNSDEASVGSDHVPVTADMSVGPVS